MEDYKNVRITLEACRINAHKTQKEWAEMLGVTGTTICSWENGQTEPTLSQLRKISEMSGVPISFIVVQ